MTEHKPWNWLKLGCKFEQFHSIKLAIHCSKASSEGRLCEEVMHHRIQAADSISKLLEPKPYSRQV